MKTVSCDHVTYVFARITRPVLIVEQHSSEAEA
jgi:hypothetical protein